MASPVSRILITGSQGFIGRNFAVRLGEKPDFSIMRFDRGDDPSQLSELVANADAVVHLAGENRPNNESAFAKVNTDLTVTLCDAIRREYYVRGRRVTFVLASSIQAEFDNPYGRSKLAAEDAVRTLANDIGNPGIVVRLPGVFGKWCRPNYNSVVATFCHNIAHGLPIRIDNPSTVLRLVYVDDVVEAFLSMLEINEVGFRFADIKPEYETTLGDLATEIKAFDVSRETLHIERVGVGLTRALYSTYLSYLPKERFAYEIPRHTDERGVFVEMLKTKDSGQFSFFTAHPGVTRGGHYHHTKSEKFLVIQGQARFRFRHLVTEESIDIHTTGDVPQVVETIPGWAHDVTNVGPNDLVVMLWANEVFDHDRPDTIAAKV